MTVAVKHIHSQLSYIKSWNCIIYFIAIDSILQQFSINLYIFFYFLKTHFFVLCRERPPSFGYVSLSIDYKKKKKT